MAELLAYLAIHHPGYFAKILGLVGELGAESMQDDKLRQMIAALLSGK